MIQSKFKKEIISCWITGDLSTSLEFIQIKTRVIGQKVYFFNQLFPFHLLCSFPRFLLLFLPGLILKSTWSLALAPLTEGELMRKLAASVQRSGRVFQWLFFFFDICDCTWLWNFFIYAFWMPYFTTPLEYSISHTVFGRMHPFLFKRARCHYLKGGICIFHSSRGAVLRPCDAWHLNHIYYWLIPL